MKRLFIFAFVIGLCCCMSSDESTEPVTDGQNMSDVLSFDPHSMAIMRLAAEQTIGGLSGSEIEPTHRYIRFFPSTEQQFDTLLEMDGFDCYNTPIGTDASETLEEGVLYAVVPVSVEIPDEIAYEIIEEYFDPTATEMGRMNPVWCENMSARAHTLTQNIEVIPGLKPAVWSWLPSGKISVWDDYAGKYLPLQGVRITIVNPSDILNQTTVTTDKNGAFVSTKTVPVGTKVNYLLSWEDAGWVIKSSRTTLAGMSAVRMTGAWDLKIKTHPALAHATIFRAAYRYWHKMPAYGLTPPEFGRQVRIVNYDAVPEENAGIFHSTPDFRANEPDIEICGRHNNTAQLFATAAHELGHAAHFSYNEPYYHKVNKFIKESWARFSEYLITDIEYKELGISLHSHSMIGGKNYENPDYFNFQNWHLDNRILIYSRYSPVFIDLYDDFNQHKWYLSVRPSPSMTPLLEWIPDDDISIPNAREIQEIAFGSKNSREAGGWIIQYAARYGISNDVIDRYWKVYAMVNE